MAEGGLYEKVLARLGTAGKPVPEKAPLASAAVVPWRRRADGDIEVYWVRRAEELRFMGGWYAFPGGGVAKKDREIAVGGAPLGAGEGPSDGGLPAAVVDGLGDLGPAVGPGLAACALRELFEETGLLVARETVAATPDAALLEAMAVARRRLLAKEIGFAALADGAGSAAVRLDATRLVYAGRWLTPQLGPLRFDNRFFLLEWPAERALQPSVLPGELERGEWVRPAEAYARWQRGEILTAPPILHILRTLAERGLDDGGATLAELRRPAGADLGPFRRVEFRPGVLLFPLRTPTLPPAAYTNAYVLGTGEAVLVDPGSPFEREIGWLAEAVEALAADGRRVTAIWLTHHHPDHVGGVEALRRALGVPVLAHPATAARLADRGLGVDGELADGQRVVLAGDPPFPLRVIHTPGHARGHLCFFDETWGSVASGDLVSGLSTIVIDPPEGDMSDYLASLDRLRAARPRVLFPSHGPPISDPDAKLAEYLEHRLWREAKILEAWRAGRRTPAEMLPEVYADVPEVAHPLAERQILAHLARLESLGRLRPAPSEAGG